MNEVRHTFQVMTYDIDAAGVLNNIVYVRWLEDLRNRFAEHILPINEAYHRGLAPALARTEVDYLAPVQFPDKLDGRMGMLEHGRAKFILWADFTSQVRNEVVVRARQTGVFVDLKTLRPVALPPEFRALGAFKP